MNYIDYRNWAKEYRDQVEILDYKLERRKGVKRFPTADDRKSFENATRILREMRLDCIRALAILEQKAAEVEEEEFNA